MDTNTTAETLRRLTTTRAAHRGQMTKLLKKIEEMKLVVEDPPSQMQQQTFRTTYESVVNKCEYLSKFDETVIEATVTDDLAEAIAESDDYLNDLKVQSNNIEVNVFNVSDSNPVNVSKTVNLPKLQLPRFDGNFLKWIGFRDAFTSAVDKDSHLDNIQKFQYLKAQLIGDAPKAIEGLQLTSANYTEAMELLKQRYGQEHKLIACYMKALSELPMPSNSLESVRDFYDNLETFIRGLKSLGKSEETYGDLLVPIVFEKLPGHIRTHISRDHGDKAWTITDLKAALYREIEAAQAGGSLENIIDVPFSSTASTFHVSSYQKKSCAFCRGTHFHKDCVVVTDPKKRRDIVMRERLCFNCLRGKHMASECKSSGRCLNCHRKHHTAICITVKPSTTCTTGPKGSKVSTVTNSEAHINLAPASGPVLLKSAAGTIQSITGYTKVNILFDEGAQRTFITRDTAIRLGIDLDACETENLKLGTFGASARGIQAVKLSSVNLITREGNIDLRVLIVPKIAAPMKNYVKSTVASYAYLQNLTLAPAVSPDTFEIDMLIGAGHFWSLVGSEVVRGPGPTAVSSKLGYLLSGPTNMKTEVGVYQTICLLELSNNMLDTHQDIANLSKFWDLEAIGITDDDAISNKRNFETFRDENICKTDGKYSAQLPWRPNHPPLPTNYNVCYARTPSMIHKLSPPLLNTYSSIMTDQLAREFIERVPDDDVTIGHYIPHNCVTKNSATTPIRIVYDCSCKQSNSPSLNNCLETGPTLMNDLVGILLRFRVNDIAFSADIEKAFLNIQLDADDRDYTKFLWLSNPQEPNGRFDTYRLKVILFGATCSPFILNAVLKTHLESNPCVVSDDLIRNTYIDNVISGIKTGSIHHELASEMAINYYMTANSIMLQGGFKLRMWASNHPKLRQIADKDGNGNPDNSVSVVGLRWSTADDTMTYAKNSNVSSDVLHTKREVVRVAASTFDPLGFLAPVNVQAKLLIQKLWQHNHEWDDLLSDELATEWSRIHGELNSAKDILFKRPYFVENLDYDCDLHVFADASSKAYGAVCYLKRGNETALIGARTVKIHH